MTTTQSTPDTDLVARSRKGDQAAFAEIYDRYVDRLHSYCFVMLRDHNDAADATQDTFVKAATKLGQLRDPEKLRPWLFAIARNEVNAIGRGRSRTEPVADLSESLVSDPDPTYGLAQEELKALVWTAVAGLQDRDRELMTMNLVEGLEGEDLASALGVSLSHVYVMVSRMRERIEKALGALLIARLGREECDELDELLSAWDGTFSLEVRSSVTRHVESCDVCRERRALLVAPANLLPSVIFIPAAELLRSQVLESAAKPLKAVRRRRRIARSFGAALVALVVVGGSATLANVWNAPAPQDVNSVNDTTTTTGSLPPHSIPSVSGPDEAKGPPATNGRRLLPDETDLLGTTSSTSVPTVQPPTAPQTQLVLDTMLFDFGDQGTVGTVTLTNDGDSTSDWSVSPGSASFGLSPVAGKLDPGETVQLTVTFSRGGLSEGDYAQSFVFSGSSESLSLAVAASVEFPPAIASISLNPTLVAIQGTFCHPNVTQISVEASDDTAVASVIASWTGTVQGELALAYNGSMYLGTIGPFVMVGNNIVTVEVTDTRGNTTQGQTLVFAENC